MIYKKLKKYVPEKIPFAVLGILFSVGASVFSVLSYKYMYRFLQEIVMYQDMDRALPMAWRIILYLVISSVVYFAAVSFTHILAFRLETNLKNQGLQHLLKASFSFYDKNESGRIRKVLDDNTGMTHMSVAHLIPDLSTAIFTPVLGTILAFTIDYRLGILMLLTYVIGGLLLQRMMGDKAFMASYMEASNKMNAGAVEYVRGITVLKIFKTSVSAIKDFYRSVVDYADLALKYSMSCRGWYVAFQVFFNAVFLLTLFLQYVGGGDPMELLVKIIFYTVFNGIMIVAFMKIMYVGMYVFQANTCIEKIEALFEEMDEHKAKSGTVTEMEGYDIVFKNVSFGYDKDLVIKNLSFALEAGKKYALVGASGSGKSTIAKLISGFYRLNEGQIYIGNHSLEEYTEETVAANIANVFQDAKLFKTTIYDNVQIGNPNASYQEVMEAMHLAQCDDILDKFAQREKTMIGAKGVHLSGGEVQRLTIARAILKNAKIVIMDEASAAADPENEYELQKALGNLMKDKTVIMIAHRLSSIINVDEILVTDQGNIIERGNHRQLMNTDSHYRALQEEYMQANQWRVI